MNALSYRLKAYLFSATRTCHCLTITQDSSVLVFLARQDHSTGANSTHALLFLITSLSRPGFQSPAPRKAGELRVLTTYWSPKERHLGQEPTDLQGFEDDPGVPGRSGSVVLELLLQSTPQPREVRGRVVSPRALVVNGTEGFREAAQLPEPVLDKLLWHL